VHSVTSWVLPLACGPLAEASQSVVAVSPRVKHVSLACQGEVKWFQHLSCLCTSPRRALSGASKPPPGCYAHVLPRRACGGRAPWAEGDLVGATGDSSQPATPTCISSPGAQQGLQVKKVTLPWAPYTTRRTRARGNLPFGEAQQLTQKAAKILSWG
jgi:hypothetical protein